MQILDTVFVYRLAKGEKLAYHGRYHMHEGGAFEIHLFLEGEGTFLSNTTRIRITENSLFLSGPYEFHSIIPEKVTRPITYYAVLFLPDSETDAEVCRLLADFSLKRKIQLQNENTNRFLFEELLRLAVLPEDGCKKSAQHLLTSFLFRWYSSSTNTNNAQSGEQQNQPQTATFSVQDRNVKKALALFEESVCRNVTMQEIAYKLGFSVEHFTRLFRQQMHMPPHQYFMRLKAQTASAMLITTQASIAEIAETLGFETQFHFSRTFKKCTGMPPLTYRKWYAQSV